MNIGIDLGGTNIRGGIVHENRINHIAAEKINANGSDTEVVQQLFAFTDNLFNETVNSIGIGIPGMVNEEKGLIFDVVNIPSWKEIPLRHLMEERYQVPIFINNDANCFALGEYYFGRGKELSKSSDPNTMIGLAIGTGLGSGIIINGKLFSGKNCGTGEFGMMDYLDQCVEYYASGQFFQNVHNTDGETAFEKAKSGDEAALKMFAEMGHHLGAAIKTMVYAFEADLIVIGGSVRHAYPYFEKSMWEQVNSFAYKIILNELKIEVSELDNAAILGAAALQFNHLK